MEYLMQKIMRIKRSYYNYFNIKDTDIQFVLADDMYECQKNYGFCDEDIQTLDEATARHNWKHVAACMKYPKRMDEPFTLIFKRPYIAKVSDCELYRLVFHELTHYVDYKDYARINKLKSYQELFNNPQTALFQNWSEYHAERRGYAAWLKHRYGIRIDKGEYSDKVDIMHKETVNNIVYYGEHYTNTAEYGSARHIYFTMHLLARTSIWMQVLPYHVGKILNNEPFTYRGIEWIKKLMVLFYKYPDLPRMNDHFMDIARIIAENMALTEEEMWEITE